MARQSPDRRNAEDPDAGFGGEDELGDADVLDDDAERDPQATMARDPGTESLWADLRIDPVEIALPTGSGYTLRAYRPIGELTPADFEREEDEDDPFAARVRRLPDEDDHTGIFDDLDEAEEYGETKDEPGTRTRPRRGRRAGADLEETTEADLDEVDDTLDGEALDEAESAAAEDEDIPVFLGHRGRLLLFRTPESLVEFVRSGAENDLAQLDTWTDLVERVRPEDVTAAEEDSYELDLVVENLRGGRDVWDPELLISAGEIARDLAYALRVEPILTALSAGSPLDDLDEALRTTVSGGLGGFLGRRRLRRIGAQQATLGWRTIIGKISGVVDWRD